ncbi:MAG: DinB family protein [Candidatus Hermodarchaeota archaeon]
MLLEKALKYLIWADQEMKKMLEVVTDNEFYQQFGDYGGSIYNRCKHLAIASWGGYIIVSTEEPEYEPDFDSMSREELLDTITTYNQKLFDLIRNKPKETYEITRGEKTVSLHFEDLVFNAINHATYHRGQIMMALRLLEKDIYTTDYVPYLFQTR